MSALEPKQAKTLNQGHTLAAAQLEPEPISSHLRALKSLHHFPRSLKPWNAIRNKTRISFFVYTLTTLIYSHEEAK